MTLLAAFDSPPTDRLILYLPLAQVAEQPGAIHNHVTVRYAVYFARSIESLGEHLKEVHPTIFFGVPRIWEKMHAGIAAKLAGATGFKAVLARWALTVGQRWHTSEFGACGCVRRWAPFSDCVADAQTRCAGRALTLSIRTRPMWRGSASSAC